MGFTLDESLAEKWIAADPRNAEVLFPYLNGDDLNSRPDSSASRWVIDFGTRSRGDAETYHLPYVQVLDRVKPDRDKVKIVYRRENWWRFAAWAPSLRNAIAGMSEVLVITRHSKTVAPLRVPTNQVFSDALVVFATASYSDQAVLSSSLHQRWAITYGSTLETRVRYTPSDVFETLPRPKPSDRLMTVGHVLDEERRGIMLRRELGLTKLYNLVNDSAINGDVDVDRLRDIHAEVDEATAAAYGWNDIRLDHGFHQYRGMERFSISATARVELLDRLLAENHRRAPETCIASSVEESI